MDFPQKLLGDLAGNAFTTHVPKWIERSPHPLTGLNLTTSGCHEKIRNLFKGTKGPHLKGSIPSCFSFFCSILSKMMIGWIGCIEDLLGQHPQSIQVNRKKGHKSVCLRSVCAANLLAILCCSTMIGGACQWYHWHLPALVFKHTWKLPNLYKPHGHTCRLPQGNAELLWEQFETAAKFLCVATWAY